MPSNRSKDSYNTKLQFIHIPCTFGHTVEESGMLGAGEDPAKDMHHLDSQAGQMAWGEMITDLSQISDITGCNLFYTPPKYWPSHLQQSLLQHRSLFTMLRDPYDRLANEFRMQVGGIDSVFTLTFRKTVSQREGHMEREGAEYQRFYQECDVNGYLQAELKKYLAGDRFRTNCHLLPSAEFFDTLEGIQPIDERKIPESFNAFMEEHGAAPRMSSHALHNIWCDDVSAYSLNEETKKLIRKVYAEDFRLTCKYFNYCDDHEMFCHENIPSMCGSKP